MIATKKIAKRGRPAGFDRDRAVETAMRLFWRNGYAGVSVAELGQAIGINPPSLYLAFGSKAGLFREALERYSAKHGAFFAAAFASERPVAETLERMFRDAVAVYTGDEECRGCLIMDGARGVASGDAVLATAEARGRAAAGFEAMLGRSSPGEARALAAYAVFVLAGLSASARDGATCDELLRNVDCAMIGLRARLGAAGTAP